MQFKMMILITTLLSILATATSILIRVFEYKLATSVTCAEFGFLKHNVTVDTKDRCAGHCSEDVDCTGFLYEVNVCSIYILSELAIVTGTFTYDDIDTYCGNININATVFMPSSIGYALGINALPPVNEDFFIGYKFNLATDQYENPYTGELMSFDNFPNGLPPVATSQQDQCIIQESGASADWVVAHCEDDDTDLGLCRLPTCSLDSTSNRYVKIVANP